MILHLAVEAFARKRLAEKLIDDMNNQKQTEN